MAIDAKTKNNKDLNLKIYLNGNLIKQFVNGIPIQTNVLYYISDKKYLPHQYKWVFIPFDKNLISNTNKIEIEIVTENGELKIYGDYTKSSNYFIGPSFFRTFTSAIELNPLYLLEKGYIDTRFIEKIKLSSLTTKSYLIKNNVIYSNDLSDSYGKQYGNYRVRILLKRKGEWYLKENYKPIENYYFGFVGLIRPVENKIVEYLPAPKEGYIPAPKNVRIYLQTEYDRYYTGYEIF